MMKWIPFSAGAAVLGGLAWWCWGFGNDWLISGGVLAVLALVFALTALAEYAVHYWDETSLIYERFQRAKNSSVVATIAEAIRNQHPKNAEILLRFTARAVWDVKVDMDTRERDVMLRGTNIHLGFVEFVLNHSTNGKLYPRWKFSEGSFAWDRLVSDRAQHEEFELWLSTRLIVARAFDKAEPVFLPPWTPELVKEAMGIADQIEYFTPKVKAVARELPAEKKPYAVGQPAGAGKERELSDADMENIKALEAEHQKKNKMTVEEYLKSKQQ